MKKEAETEEQLINELVEMRQQIAELENAEADRKRTEVALWESKEKYRVLFEMAKDAIFLSDVTGTFVDVNQVACESLGCNREELLKLSNKEIDADPLGYEAFLELRNGAEEQTTFDVNQRRKDGTLLPVEITGSFFTCGGQRIALAIARDITERKQAEEALRESEEKMRTILDSMPDVVLQLDTNLKILWANKATLEMKRDAIGQLCYKALPGRNDLCPNCPIVKALKTGQIERGIVHLQSVAGVGESYWDDVGVPIKDAQGKIISIVKLARNVTDNKKAEDALKASNENFQQVVSNITTVVWKADIGKNGTFENTYTSPVTDELLELPAGTIQNDWNKYFSYIKPDYLERVNNAFREAIMSPSKKIDCEYEVLKNNGQTAWFYSKGRCFEKNGKLHVFGSTTDITDRKKAEELLKIHTKELEILNKIITSGNKAQDLQSLLVDVLDAVLDLMDFEGGGIGLVDETTRTAELVCHKGLPSDFVENVKQEKIDVSPYDTIFVKGQPIFADNYSRVNSKRSEKWGFLSVASIPLFAKGKVVGALNVASKSRHSFSEGEKNILRSIGQEIGTVIAKMQAEETLDQSEKKFQEIFNGVSDAVFIHDIKDLSIIDVNDEVCRRFGYTKEEIKKMSIDELSEGPVSLVDSPESKELFKRIMNGELVKNEWLSKNKDGDTFWHEMNLKLVELEGKKRLLAVARDITERKEMEKKIKKRNEQLGMANLDLNSMNRELTATNEKLLSTQDELKESRGSIEWQNVKLEKKIGELERYKKVTVDRELKMVELKKRIKELEENEMNGK